MKWLKGASSQDMFHLESNSLLADALRIIRQWLTLSNALCFLGFFRLN